MSAAVLVLHSSEMTDVSDSRIAADGWYVVGVSGDDLDLDLDRVCLGPYGTQHEAVTEMVAADLGLPTKPGRVAP